MDNFGIGNSVVDAATAAFITARKTGRTTRLVASAKNGDRIVFTNQKEANRVNRLCDDRGVNVECIVLHPRQPERLFDRGRSDGRTIFDHSWVEEYYRLAIDSARTDVDRFERAVSSHEDERRMTESQAKEMRRWRP